MENKIKFLLLGMLVFVAVSVLAGNAFGNGKGDKMDDSVLAYGHRGLTGNISYMDGEGNPGFLILKNGMIVDFVIENVSNETNSTDNNQTNQSSFPYDGLVSYYSFDADASDDYGDNNGAVYGAAHIEGKLGMGYDFETDENDSILTDVTREIVDHSFSTSVWIKPESHDINMRIFSQRNSVNGNPTNTFNFQTDGKIWWNIRGNNGAGLTQLVSSQELFDGNWYHIVTTYNASTKEMRLYTNAGVPSVETYSGGSWNSVDAQMVGSSPIGNPASFDGVIDELGIWDRVLSPGEILELYNKGHGLSYEYNESNNSGIVLQEDLRLFYNLKEDEDANFGLYNLTNAGGVVFNGDGADFDHGNKNERLYVNSDLGMGSLPGYTVALDFKMDSYQNSYLFNRYHNTNKISHMIRPYNDGTIHFQYVRYNLGSQEVVSSPVSLNEWHTAVFVINGRNSKAYLDGEFVGEINGSGDGLYDYQTGMAIGNYLTFPSTYSFDGAIRNVGIWDKLFAAEEVGVIGGKNYSELTEASLS